MPTVRPLRLALACDWYPPRVGGIETHVRALAEQLAAAGHRVDVLTTAGGCREDGAPPVPAGDEVTGRVRVRRLALPCFPHFRIAVALPHTYARVRRALVAGDYDLVHAHASVVSPFAFCAAAAAGRLGMAAVLTHHSMLGGAAELLAFADRLIGWTRWRVMHTAVSPLVADDVRAAAARAARPEALSVGILPNGIHPEAWAAVGPAAGLAGGPHEFRVASVMRLSQRKRPLALLDVVDRVRAGLPPDLRLRVRVAGDGPERAAVECEIARRGLDHTVELLGFRPREEVRALYAESDAFVLPSILESFGIAALEARCAGLPVVALRAAGPASFIGHEVEGLLGEDDADLAHQLLRLATDDRLRAGIARHNRRTLPAETWSAVLARHTAAYADARRLARGMVLRGVPAATTRTGTAGPAVGRAADGRLTAGRRR